jgi:hypothetical protein
VLLSIDPERSTKTNRPILHACATRAGCMITHFA